MKKLVIIFMIPAAMFAQSATQIGVAPEYISGSDTLFNGMPYDVGRGAHGGVDLDGDMKKEIWITSYAGGGRVYCFEDAGDNTMAFVWASPELTQSGASSTPRDLGFGDMDGDGNMEVIFQVGYTTSDGSGNVANPESGIYIYENTADNLYDNVYHAHMLTALNDSLAGGRVEGLTVDDIDGDSKDEILMAWNGGSSGVYGTADASTKYSEDRYLVLGLTGSIGGTLQDAALTTEYAISPRDVDKDGTNENALGGGSCQDIIVADIDNDGKKEAHCLAYNNSAYFSFEATGADAYTLGDTNFVKFAVGDDWTLGMAAADVDNDGKDEVYLPSFGDAKLFVITDSDGDAQTLDTTGVAAKTFVGNSEMGIISTTVQHGAAAGSYGVAIGGSSSGADMRIFAWGSGSVVDASNWTEHSFTLSTMGIGTVQKISSLDWDGDTNQDFLLPYKGVNNTYHPDSSAYNRVFRIAEFDATATVSVDDYTLIMPEDYKLIQNYPNPFNPTTTIEYFLPVANNISVTIYNMVGQEIIKLVDRTMMDAGSHSVVWNGLGRDGFPVSSGTYIYELRYGNMSKVRQMTFMK